MYNILFMSDTHGQHDKIPIDKMPEADCVIHCGDFTNRGRMSELREFLTWYDSLPYTRKIIMPGNHDLTFENNMVSVREVLDDFPGIECYFDQTAFINEWEVYFYPWTPKFYDWAFMKERKSSDLFIKVSEIPETTQILISHGPPHGVLDRTAGGDLAGCEMLVSRIDNLPKLKVCVFGHIHEGFGECHVRGIRFINASVLADYKGGLRVPHQIVSLA